VAKSFDIKSTHLQLVALLFKTADVQQVTLELAQQFGPQGESPDFFDNDPLVLDFSHIAADQPITGLPALVTALTACRLKPLMFRAINSQHTDMALAAGLVEVPLDVVKARPVAAANPPVPEVEIREIVKEVVREVTSPSALVIDKPLRSGQKIYARGSDLVMLAIVNQGAEVVADGNIHVYAPLRGKAMAGASGNAQARIFSICLEPELISIAGVYRTSETPLAADIQGKPAQVRLSDDGQEKLLFEALNS
jgi:septum site-determining protein MinC